MSVDITLSDGSTTVTLPDNLLWVDEFDWAPISETATSRTLDGTLVRQVAAGLSGGRPISLAGGWAERSVIKALRNFQAAGGALTLTLHDSSTYTVAFAGPEALEARAVIDYQEPADTDLYEIVNLKLVELA